MRILPANPPGPTTAVHTAHTTPTLGKIIANSTDTALLGTFVLLQRRRAAPTQPLPQLQLSKIILHLRKLNCCSCHADSMIPEAADRLMAAR